MCSILLLCSLAPAYDHGGINRQRTLIDILDDDSLLNIFYHCRPAISEIDMDIESRVVISVSGWQSEGERWWYKPTQVCRRWRHLILASPSYLGLSLVCGGRSGTPVADMLVHSPPFPLIIDHRDNIFWQDPEGTRLALEHRDRVRCIRLRMRILPLMNLIASIDGSFPLLEYLYICPLNWPNMGCPFPFTLRAPNLRHLVLHGSSFPFQSPLLVGLVTLILEGNPSANFGPTELLQQLSLMPHLETFRITFPRTLSNQHVERKFLRKPLSTHVTLPTLRWFGFGGPSAYMEVVLPRITAPLLKITEIASSTSDLLNLTSSIIFTLRSMCETEDPKLCDVKVTFNNVYALVTMYPHRRTDMPTLRLRIFLTMSLESPAQVFDGIRAVFTEVESLTLEDEISYGHLKKRAIRTGSRWCELLRSFDKVRTLHVSGSDLIEGLSRSLRPHDGESAIELLPMLRVLSFPKGSHVGESCRSLIAIRQNAGHPVIISYH